MSGAMTKDMKLGDIFVADFETITDANDCRIWAWGIAYVFGNSESNFVYGNTMDGFIDFLESNHPKVMFFHNLAFDGSFIIYHLCKYQGYEFRADPSDLLPGEYSTLVSSKGKFYTITLKTKKGHTINIVDSLKLFPMGVADVASAFGTKMEKGEIDYDAYREMGHELTPEEVDYLKRDVEIVAVAIEENWKKGLYQITIGSNAMHWYKEHYGAKPFKRDFPVLSLDMDAYIRRAYRGGFTYVNPEYAGVDVGPGVSVDYNSMYPSMMISKDYPVGVPEKFTGEYIEDKNYPLYVQTLTCMFTIKPNGIPMIQLHGLGFYGEHEYVRETIEPVQITLTSVDMALFMDNYDVDVISWDGGVKFRSKSGERLFGLYVKYWGNIKRKSRGAARTIAKLMLNNLYGKFGSNPDVTQKYPIYNPDTDKVELVMGPRDIKPATYIPVAAFCTAYARDTLIRAIMNNRDRFVYCDTDSMHLLGTSNPKDIPLHDTNLCAWKVEGSFTRARHLRAKCYIWDLNGEVGVTCAGMSKEIKAHANFDNFYFGFKNFDLVDGVKVLKPGWDKLVPKRVPGGVVLTKVAYELKDDV